MIIGRRGIHHRAVDRPVESKRGTLRSVLHAKKRPDDFSDPFRGRFDVAVSEMGVSQRHSGSGMDEQP